MLLPTPTDLGAFTIETKTVTIQLLPGTVPVGGVAAWTVQFVVCDGEGGPVKLRKTLADGIVLNDATLGSWTTTFSPQDLGQTIGPGYWWYNFERLDTGAELMIARGRFPVQLASR